MSEIQIDLARAIDSARTVELTRSRQARQAVAVARLQRKADRLAHRAERAAQRADQVAGRARLARAV